MALNLPRFFLLILLTVCQAGCDERIHLFKEGEEVNLWMGMTRPYYNQLEVYKYSSLPFCHPPKTEIQHHGQTLGEALLGVELEFSGIKLHFKGDVLRSYYCNITLSKEQYNVLVNAVKNHYWYQMYIDDLPIQGPIGQMYSTSDAYIWTHKKFEIGYNGQQIVDVNLSSEAIVKLRPGGTLVFTFEVKWSPSQVKFEDRFNKYLDTNFFKEEIQWFSIINSALSTAFLIAMVIVILLRTLKNYVMFNKKSVVLHVWKDIHGDVFRPPPHPMLLSALVGNGCHIAVTSLGVILFAVVKKPYTERGLFLNMVIIAYAVTSPINGFFGGSLYSRMGGKQWIKQMLLSVLLLPTAACGIIFFVDCITMFYHVFRIISPSARVLMVMFGILPLHLVGTLIGKVRYGNFSPPCAVSNIPRPIPERRWFRRPLTITVAGGILPFGVIFIQSYYILSSICFNKIYFVYGFLLMVFLLLILISLFDAIVCVFFLLEMGDHHWQWMSFLVTATTGGYFFLYSIQYFFTKAKISGLFATTSYFVYVTFLSFVLGIMCGAVGHIGSSHFVQKIYSSLQPYSRSG